MRITEFVRQTGVSRDRLRTMLRHMRIQPGKGYPVEIDDVLYSKLIKLTHPYMPARDPQYAALQAQEHYRLTQGKPYGIVGGVMYDYGLQALRALVQELLRHHYYPTGDGKQLSRTLAIPTMIYYSDAEIPGYKQFAKRRFLTGYLRFPPPAFLLYQRKSRILSTAMLGNIPCYEVPAELPVLRRDLNLPEAP